MIAHHASTARILVISAALLWSLSGVVLKSPVFEGLPAESRGPAIAALRAVFAALVLAPFAWKRPKRWRLGLIPMTLCFTAMSVLFISAMMATSSAATIFLQYTSVLWACLLAWWLLRERPGKPDFVALACVFVGFWLILAFDSGSLIGNLLALASGVTYAGVIVSLRALRDEDPIWLSFLNQLVSAIVLVPWFFLYRIELNATQLSLIAFLGAVQLALPYVLFSIGVQAIPAREASLLLLIEPLANPLWVLLVWHEPVVWTTWLAGGIILTGLVLRFALGARAAPRPTSRSIADGESMPVSASARPAPPEDP